MGVQPNRPRREILLDEAAFSVVLLFGSFFLFVRFGSPWAFLGPPALALASFVARVPLKLRGRLRRDYSARGWIKRGLVVWVGFAALYVIGALRDPEEWRYAPAAIGAMSVAAPLTVWLGYRRSRRVEDPEEDTSRGVRLMAVAFLAIFAVAIILGAVLSQID